MGFLSDITDIAFGEKPKVKKTSQPTLSPEQEALMADLIGRFSGQAKPVSTDLSPAQTTSLAGLEELALQVADPSQVSEGQDTLRSILSEGRFTPGSTLVSEGADVIKGAVGERVDPSLDSRSSDFLMDIAGDATGDFDRFFQQNVADPLFREFSEEVLPMLDRKFGGADFFGSERVEAARRLTDDLVSQLTRGRNELLLGTREQAIGAAGRAGQLDLGRGGAELEAGVAQRGQDIQAGGALAGAGIDQSRILSDAFLGARGQDIQAAEILDTLARGDTETALSALTTLFEAGGVQKAMERGERDTILNTLIHILNTKMRDNTVVATPGTPGLFQSFLGGLGGGVGEFLGRKIGKG